jgi:hypothetical protein
MTTARQIRQLVRPLLKRHPDLALVTSDSLWLTPVTHVARVIHIGRTSSALYCKPSWWLLPLFLPDTNPTRDIGFCTGYIRTPTDASKSLDLWFWDNPLMMSELHLRIEKTLRLLRTLDNLRSCRSFTEAHMDYTWGKTFVENIVYDIAMGNLKLARCWLHKVNASCPRLCERIREIDEPLMDDDRAALAAVLHRWERENVAGTEVEPFWTPTPFPLELTG